MECKNCLWQTFSLLYSLVLSCCLLTCAAGNILVNGLNRQEKNSIQHKFSFPLYLLCEFSACEFVGSTSLLQKIFEKIFRACSLQCGLDVFNINADSFFEISIV